ncbi:endonuclease V [Cladochytrium replicatum]|nr:endonuclease V [Cladochytrium replicatum]
MVGVDETRRVWELTQADLEGRRVATDKLDIKGDVLNADDIAASLKYIAGVDISFVGEVTADPSNSDASAASNAAVVCVAVLDARTLELVDHVLEEVTLTLPYIPGFLAFREAAPVLSCLEKLKNRTTYPQLLFVDGNGTLHPRRFGSACHIGVLADIPTIGIGKNFLEIRHDGLLMKEVKARARSELGKAGSYFELIGSKTGFVYGAAVRATAGAVNPVFVSPGHRVSFETAVSLAKFCSRHRVPEPIRHADHLSREYIRLKKAP